MWRRYGVECLALVMSLLAIGLGGCRGLRSSHTDTRPDHTAPRVELFQPQIRYGTGAERPVERPRWRGFDVVRKAEPITVSGRVTDDTGVAHLSVNGHEVQVESGGQFSVQLPVVLGENTLHIRALDTYNNALDITFAIVVDN
jgi:hypothetical protein